MIVSSFLCFLFTETKGKDLEDTMRTSLNHRESSLINSIKLKPVLDHTTVKIDDIVKPASRKADTPEKDTRSGTISEIVDA